MRERQYTFDRAFDKDTAQAAVFEYTRPALVDTVLSGMNATCFAYGPTGTGKTYTMLGTDDNPGLMINVLADLFSRIASLKETTAFTVTMQYIEVSCRLIRGKWSDLYLTAPLRYTMRGCAICWHHHPPSSSSVMTLPEMLRSVVL